MTTAGVPLAEPSLWEPLGRESRRADLLVVWDGARFLSWSWDHWRRESLKVAGGLQRLGVSRGDRVACLLTNSPGACAAILGVWWAGGCVVSVPLLSRGMSPPQYQALLGRVVAQANAEVLLCDDSLQPTLEAVGFSIPVVGFQTLQGAAPTEPDPPATSAPAFVQYTSGSTTQPRGCVLSPAAIAHQLAALQRALDIDPERDTGAVWLPLSHDMGLFGCLLLTYWTDHRLILSSPQRFLTQPGSWFDDCARYGATLSAAPSFALDMATRVATKRPPGAFRMRALVIGGEPVDAGTLERATAVLGESRLPGTSLVPAYGLAEAVLAVAMTPLGHGAAVRTVDSHALAQGALRLVDQRATADGSTRTLVSGGIPLQGNHLVVDGGPVGELIIESPWTAEGYLDDPVTTATRFTPRGLRTGDIGFVDDGQVYIAGRQDDLMFIAGRNLYARDVEAALRGVSGVRAGRYAIVDVETSNGRSLVAVVEPNPDHPDLRVMTNEIVAAARRGSGAAIDECVFVPRGQLPRTPSGKVQRFRCRELASDRSLGKTRRVMA